MSTKMNNEILNKVYEELMDGPEIPDFILEFIRNRIKFSLFCLPPKQYDNYLEFSLFLRDYVVYIDAYCRPKMIEKTRFLYLKNRNKI